ncbi:glycosyltransferase [Curtobacterium flaccumfaciens]|nr:glycosyltransferase [Curtobacterium flaccumfaciens]
MVAVGRLVEKKGFGNLIEALRGLGDDVPWRLTVVGDGPYRTQLEQQAAGLPVSFLGQRGRTEVLETLASATVVAVPSIPAANGDQEGLPVTLLEAAAVGAAIVASDLPGIRDVVQDDVSGVLVPPGDVPALRAALQRVLTGRHGADALPGAGRRLGGGVLHRADRRAVPRGAARSHRLTTR